MQTDTFPHFRPQNHEQTDRRRELPAIFTHTDDQNAMRLFGLPEEVAREQDDADRDQKISDEFFLSPMHPFKVASAPDPAADPFFSPPYPSPLISQSDVTETDMSASPAALFLSAFSPPAASTALPDDEGESVAGYVLGPIIGHGAFALVRRAASPQGGTVAVKIVRRSDVARQTHPARARAALDREAAVWAALSHEHVLPLFAAAHTPYADFFVTLYCPAGSLFDILKRDGRPALPQDEAGRMFRQVVKGLRYMHEVAGYVHRDLKLENVLVDEMGMCRIGDFGMAKPIGEVDGDEDDEDERPAGRVERAQTVRQKRSAHRLPQQSGLTAQMSLLRHHSGPRHRNSSPLPAACEVGQKQVYASGSLPYAAPELLTPASSRRARTSQDIWALGVMLYALLTGRLPFVDSFEPRLQMKILAGNFEMPEGIGKGAERVLQGCMEHSVDDRWSVEMVDEVAWGVGWGDAGDEAPCPADMLPPARSSRSHSRVAYPENALADDQDPNSPTAERPKPSRSRSGRSRSRAAAHYHPYQHDTHFPPDAPLPGIHTSILRSVSTSSSSSTYLSSIGSPAPPPPAHSAERGRSRAYAGRKLPSASRSRSPPATPVTPVEVAAALAARGRKASRATVAPAEPRLRHLPEHGEPDADWLSSPTSVRSASQDVLQAMRAGSVPPHALQWGAPGMLNARSRSVGFDLGDGRMGRACGEVAFE